MTATESTDCLTMWFGKKKPVPPPAPPPALTEAELEDYLGVLVSYGWQVTRSSGDVHLNQAFTRRYPHIPDEYRMFLSRVTSCTNAGENVWFLCGQDYNGTSDSAFAWNEFEQMGLEGAGDDEEERGQVASFWDNHLPFLYSVKGDYAHLSFRMTGDAPGSVVDGYEPDLTDVTDVAPGFGAFVQLHRAELQAAATDSVLGDYT